MSFLRRGLESRSYAAFSATANPLNVFYGQVSMWSSAGERVDEVTALGISSVLSCASLLADSVATMPLRAYRGEEEVELPAVLADPDPLNTTGFELKHTTMASLALHGNAYLHVARGRGGEPIGLTPLHPYQMNVIPAKDGQTRTYLHLGNEISPADLRVIRWFTPPQSLVGVSPLAQQRTMLGLALAMDKYLAQWYGEGGTPSGVLETDRPLSTEGLRNLRETWESSQRKHRRPAVLADGLKWRQVQTSAVDMEFNATRDSVIAEIARIFRIQPWLLGIKGDPGVYQNVEAAGITFLTYTLHPWLCRLEVAFSSLFDDVEIRFDPSSLLRLDAMTKAKVDQLKISSGTRTPNEARALDGERPYPGGDDFVMVLPGSPVGSPQADPFTEDPAVSQ